MDVVFGVERHVKVKHRRHVFDVQTACGHVGANQQIDFTLLEGLQRLQALVLALVTVQRGGFKTFALQAACQATAAEFAVDKNKRLLDAARFEHLVDGAALVVVAGRVEALLHRRGGFVGAGNFNRHRVLQVAAGQALDLGREGGAEQQRGALLGQVGQDALQIGQKANVQHPVGLVEHHVFDLVEDGVFGLDVVQQAPRRGHQHFDAFFQLDGLGLHVDAAKHHRAAQLGVLGVQRNLLRHLIGQLARGQQHQGAHRVARGRGGAAFVLEQALQERQ